MLSTEHNNVFHWNKNRRCHWPALILCSCLTSTSYHHRGKFVCYVLWPRSFPDLFRTRQEGCQAALWSAPAQTLYLKGTQLKTSPMDPLQMSSYFEISAWAFCNLSFFFKKKDYKKKRLKRGQCRKQAEQLDHNKMICWMLGNVQILFCWGETPSITFFPHNPSYN